jgi:tetraacyldisaccharide 4'-kinase
MNPLTGIYGAASALRNALFDRRMLATRRLERPVVSAGNLSVGGSGKTPFVIALGELLKARGIRFDVLSRGYRRKTRGVLVVEEDGSACDFGDEPLLIARRLGVPVVVGESRYEAGRLAEKNFESQLHILDDGFQHRSLARDFDIVLMSGGEFEDRLLPSGRLREPLSSLARADAIVLPLDFVETAQTDSALKKAAPERVSSPQRLKPHSEQGTFRSAEALRHPKAKAVWRMKREIVIAAAPRAPIVFCGLARPNQFFAQVRALGISPAAEIEFRDHHAYSRRDLGRLLAMREKAGAGGFITTEKDAVNLGPLQADLKPLAIAALRVALDNPADVVDTILERIRK